MASVRKTVLRRNCQSGKPHEADRAVVTEKLKAENQMEWVRQINACKAQTGVIVKFELIYD